MSENVSVAIPAYNEEACITQTIENVCSQKVEDFHFDVSVVANGCTDHTAEVAREAVASSNNPSFSFEIISIPEASKAKALNLALGRCTTRNFIYCDADVTFSPGCFEQVANELAKPGVRMSGAVPRTNVAPDIADSYLGQIIRARQLYHDIAGPKLMPIGRMLGLQAEAIDAFPENIAAEDTWVVASIVEKYGWDALSIAQDASVFAVAPRNWLDFIKQESRFVLNNRLLFEDFPQLEPIFDEGIRRTKALRLPKDAIMDSLAPLLESEGIPLSRLDEQRAIRKIDQDNADLMADELVGPDGRWEPIASTKSTPR